jgi:hypothetical protein
MKQLNNNYFKIYIIISFLVFIYGGCTSIRLISDYDEITDKKVNELQEKVVNHFVKLERVIGTDEAKYQNYIDFYDGVKVDLSILEIRARAIDKNDIIIKQLSLLKQNMMDLEQLHKIGFKSVSEIIPMENAFNSAFSAIIKLIIALKRGE